MKLLTLTPHESDKDVVLLILRSKGQGHGALIIENGFQTKSDALIYIRS